MDDKQAHKKAENVPPTSEFVDIYKLCVEMADRVSARRQQANTFYLSLNSAVVAALSILPENTSSVIGFIAITITGLALCAIWIRNIHSYRDLNDGKFHAIHDLEEKIGVTPFKIEWEYLGRGKDASRYRPFHKVEILVPYVFMLLYVVLASARIDVVSNFGKLFGETSSPV